MSIFAMYEHRAYRHAVFPGRFIFFELLVMLLVSLGSVYLYIKYLFNEFIMLFYSTLEKFGVTYDLESLDIYTFSLQYIDIGFKYTPVDTMIYLLVGLFIFSIFLFKQRVVALNVVFWVIFLLLLLMIFLAYFIFFGDTYAYNSEKYFHLYLSTYIGFMCMSFILLSFLFAYSPYKLGAKLIMLLGSISYYFIYSFVRFSLTVLLASEVSVVFTPFMYFTIFYDFIFIIAIYSYFLYFESKKDQKKEISCKA